MSTKSSIEIDKIILGDNQFWGVNHLSQDKGRDTGKKFSNVEEIRKILHIALDNGVRGVMFSTHPMIYEVTNMIRLDQRLRENINIYVNLPYIFKYIQMSSEMGTVESLKKIFSGKSYFGNISFVLKSAYGALTNDYLSLTNRLVDIELNPFHGLKVKAVFLHNALTDLALGYEMDNVLKNFYYHVQKKYGAIPAFGTLNLPSLERLLARAKIGDTVIMTSVNKNGFLVNPSRSSCEKTIAGTKHTILAMATLASGSLKPDEAYEYLSSLKKIKHVVVGVSTKEHAEQTFSTIKKYLT